MKDDVLDAALELLENCYEAYRRATDDIRRRFNQGFFTHIYVDVEGDVEMEVAQPFQMLLELTAPSTAGSTPTEGQEKPLAAMDLAQGLKDDHVVPLEGLEPPTVSLGRNCSSIELQRLAQRV